MRLTSGNILGSPHFRLCAALGFSWMQRHNPYPHRLSLTGHFLSDMIKFMILFQRPDNVVAFEANYNRFLALIEQMPLIIRRQVIHILGSPRGETSLYRILEVYFDSQASLEESLRSPNGQAAGQTLNDFPPNSIEMLFAEVFEEVGGQTGAAR